MPIVETSNRIHDAVLWPATGALDAYGQPILGSPVELIAASGTGVRWNDNLTDTQGAQDGTIRYDATVIVDRAIPIGSKMFKGRLSEVAPASSGSMMQVKGFKSVDDLKGRHTYREVQLVRMKDG